MRGIKPEYTKKTKCMKIIKKLSAAFLACLPLVVASCSNDDSVTLVLEEETVGNDPDDSSSMDIREPIDLSIFSYETEITDAEMLNAIDFALSQWENYIDSDIPIRVSIRLVPNLPAFGQSIPNVVKDFVNAPVNDVWYPTALANHLAGNRLNNEEFDMDIWLNPEDFWSYEIDGNIPEDQLDFVALFMHEVCHSLGFVSSAKVEEDRGSFGLVTPDDFVTTLSFPITDLEGKPLIFSTLLSYDRNGWPLLDGNKFPNDSNALFQAFESDGIFLNKPLNHGAYDFPKIFAEDPFLFGSSLSHLDEKTYPQGSGNALMTPFIEIEGNIEREPGPIVLSVLKEIGWSIK